MDGIVRCKNCKHRHDRDECPMVFEELQSYYDSDYAFCEELVVHDRTEDHGYCYKGEVK